MNLTIPEDTYHQHCNYTASTTNVILEGELFYTVVVPEIQPFFVGSIMNCSDLYKIYISQILHEYSNTIS